MINETPKMPVNQYGFSNLLNFNEFKIPKLPNKLNTRTEKTQSSSTFNDENVYENFEVIKLFLK